MNETERERNAGHRVPRGTQRFIQVNFFISLCPLRYFVFSVFR